MATHIRNRNELIEFLEEHAPNPSIARALQEGTVENLGGFFGGAAGDYWVMRVISRFNKIWYVATRPRIFQKEYHAYELKEVSWEFWEGDKSTNKLYQGDNPKEYKLLRGKELSDDRNKGN